MAWTFYKADGSIITSAVSADSATTATVATTVTVSDNESTNENNVLTFVAGADADGGNVGLESDGNLHYNPSTGLLTSTGFAGALTGNVTGNASGTAATVTGGTQASITSTANLVTVGTIGTGVWQGTAVASGYIAADAITGAKLADDAVNSEHYTDASIDTAHIGDLQITTALIAADAVTSAKIADDAIDSEHYTDGSIDNAHLADDAVDSDEIAAGAIDLAHMSSQSVDEDNLHISNSPTNGYMLTAQSGDAGGMTWAAASGRSVAGDTDNGIITWVTSDNTFAAEASLTFDGTDLAIASGNLNVADTYGIDFAAHAHVSGMVSELLDDYEEGTWTPGLADSSGDGSGESQGYATNGQIGRYTKIGNLVHVQFRLIMTSIGTLTTSQQVRVVGLPFTSKNETNAMSAFVAGSGSSFSIGAGDSVTGVMIENTAYIALSLWESATGADSFRVSEYTAAGNMSMAGSYRVA